MARFERPIIDVVARTTSGRRITRKSVIVSPPAPPSPVKPLVVGHALKLSDGSTLKMAGVSVWGIQDSITTTHGVAQYAARQTVVNTIKSWGANTLRLRLLASDYNSQAFMSKAAQLTQIQNWQTTAQAAGLYLQVCWWDALDGPYSAGNWATQYSSAFPMMTDVVNALGATNPWVVYEPFNEPNNVSDASWLAAMKATLTTFRGLGYTGILLIDTTGWSHAYNDASMTALEQWDAGLIGTHQLIFCKHDYANEGYANPDSGFDFAHWAVNGGSWNFNAHLVCESEFGNYNGSPSTVHNAWSSGAATWMASKVNDGTLVGAQAFLFGPWFDANAMTTSDNVTTTTWGGYVKTNFVGGVFPQTPPPPVGSGALGINPNNGPSTTWLNRMTTLNPSWIRTDFYTGEIQWALDHNVPILGLGTPLTLSMVQSRPYIDHWELDNEPYLTSGLNVATWAVQMRNLAASIKAWDSSKYVILPMNATNNSGYYEYPAGSGQWVPWAHRVFDAAPDIGNYVDAWSGHPYSGPFANPPNQSSNPPTSMALVDSVRGHLASRGFNKPCWITEVGWSVGAQSGYQVSAAAQAANMQQFMTWARQRTWIEAVMWYCLMTWGTGFFESFGLWNLDGSERPAAATFRSLV